MKIEIKLELDTDRDAHEIEQLLELADKIKQKIAEANEDE
jgi:hypothetical protein